MNSLPSKRGKQILLVLPETFGSSGGIQMFCRALCLAAGRWAEENVASVSALVLNDGAKPDSRYVNGGFASYVGANRSKTKFIRHYLAGTATHKFDWIIFGHVSLSPLVLFTRIFNSKSKVAVVAHGVEVWHRLSKAQRLALHRSDFVLAVSDYTKSELIKHNDLSPEKIRIFPNTLDPHWELTPTPGMLESDPPVVLSVSRMNKEDRYKGIDNVIRSLPMIVRGFGPITYRVVGHGDDIPRLKALSAALGVSRYVDFTGELPDADLRRQYQQCALFAMPSRKEGFGIVFLEAMAYGKAVVGGAHGGTPSVIDHGKAGLLLDNADVAGIGEGISSILRDAGLREKFGRTGHERLLSEFTFDRFEKNLRAILELA